MKFELRSGQQYFLYIALIRVCFEMGCAVIVIIFG